MDASIVRRSFVAALLVLAAAGCQPASPGPGPGPGRRAGARAAERPAALPRQAARRGQVVACVRGLGGGERAPVLSETLLTTTSTRSSGRLRELGVRYVRDGLCATCEYVDRLQRLGDMGIKSHIIAGDLRGGSPRCGENLNVLRTRPQGRGGVHRRPERAGSAGRSGLGREDAGLPARAVDAGEGRPGTQGRRRYWARGGATTTRGGARRSLRSYLDRGNIHPYPGGAHRCTTWPSERADASRASAQQAARRHGDRLPLRPEHHQRSLSRPPNAPSATTRRAAALEGFRHGVERSYVYQLIDPWSPRGRSPPASRRSRTPSVCCAGTCHPQARLPGAAQPARRRRRRLGARAKPRRSALRAGGSRPRRPPAAAPLGRRRLLAGALARGERVGPLRPARHRSRPGQRRRGARRAGCASSPLRPRGLRGRAAALDRAATDPGRHSAAARWSCASPSEARPRSAAAPGVVALAAALVARGHTSVGPEQRQRRDRRCR